MTALASPLSKRTAVSASPVGPSVRIPKVRIQAKLAVHPAEDIHEQEADRVADLVLRMPALGRKEGGVSAGPGTQPISCGTEAFRAATSIQRRSAPSSQPVLPEAFQARLEGLRGGGRPLSADLRTFFEPRFGFDFGRVRLHTEASAAASAASIQALAYTAGEDIVFAAGQYAPQASSGRHLLAHELTHVVQQSGGRSSGVFRASAAPMVIQRAPVATPVTRLDRLALLGDGTAVNPGLTLGAFQSYINTQADWFVEPTLAKADRDQLWAHALLLQEGEHIGAGLANIRLAELGATGAADMVFARLFAEGAKPNVQNVRISNPPDKIARVIELGKAMKDLATFVPGAVLRVCVDQASLETLVDEVLINELRTYYTAFTPTIENPAEMPPLFVLLRAGTAAFNALVDWIHDLHIFTPDTRTKLVTNVADKTRKRPVLLVLFSGLDWNAAFLQASNLESAVKNNKNLGLVIQGAKNLAEETAKMNKAADDYGQIPKSGGKAQLGQVVFAGHGAATSVEQTTDRSSPTSQNDQYVSYGQAELHPTAPGDDSEKLIDAVLARLDPKDARIVFAGCLVGSHEVPSTTDLSGKISPEAKEINAAITANPNLRDLVYQRMAALKVTGTVQAANASTTFDAFDVNAAGKARLYLSWDPHIGGSKAQYVLTGSEPEGALRAALETWADPKLGPTWTTNKMRAHVAATAASTRWYISLTRTAFKLVLPGAGDVKPEPINDLAHRVVYWLLAGWPDTVDVAGLASSVKAAEAPVVYPVMLASNMRAQPHLPVVVQEAWMSVDATHEATFLTALGATSLKRLGLEPLIDASVVDPQLPSLMTTVTPANPSRSQLILALVIAVDRGAKMPAPVQTLLQGAAGGVQTTSFPAALNIKPLLDGADELSVLRNIGLAPGAAPSLIGPKVADKANVDVDANKTNETFVPVKPRVETYKGTGALDVRDKASRKGAVLGQINAGDSVRIAGTVPGWNMIDFGGKLGFCPDLALIQLSTANLLSKYAAAKDAEEKATLAEEMARRWIKIHVEVKRTSDGGPGADEVYCQVAAGSLSTKTAVSKLDAGQSDTFWVPLSRLGAPTGAIELKVYDQDLITADDLLVRISWPPPYVPFINTKSFEGADYRVRIEFPN